MIGRKLAHYEITAHLGTGGMGEVYRATDTKLGREVAIKILPETVSTDPERLARFQREARTLASLHHAHVASIFGFEEDHGTRFLVMELVEGEDLAQRLKRGPLSLDDVIGIGRQIAEGLEHAHEKGIVHRDLKPANIKLTPDGTAKILDFGLARAYLGEPDVEDLETSPTITAAMTQAGVILGTAAYMSPEQAKGKTVDKRADVWAFGVILFEMLTGRRLFEGETISETLAAVLVTDIDWPRLPNATPAWLERLLRRCLERDPKQRLRDVGEARILLTTPPEVAEPASVTASSRRGLLLAIATLLIVSVVGNVFLLGRSGPASPGAPKETLHLAVPLPPEALLARARAHPFGLMRNRLSISPDGKTLVYVAEVGGERRLILRRLAGPEIVELPGTAGAFLPKFSPKGDWIAFFTDQHLKKVSPDGGEAITLCEAVNAASLVWEDDRTLLAAVQEAAQILRIDADSGRRELLLESPDHVAFGSFSLLPGAQFALTEYDTDNSLNPESVDVAAVSLTDGSAEVLIRGGVQAQFVPPHHLVYVRGGTLMATRFDVGLRKALGAPVPVLTNVEVGRSGRVSLAFSNDGTLAYVAGVSDLREELLWVDASGNETPLDIEPQIFGDFRTSPDGRKLAITVSGDRNEIWGYDLETGARRKLSTDTDGVSPVWSPDGRQIAFYSYASSAIYLVAADGSGAPQKLEIDGAEGRPYTWSNDGQLAISGNERILLLDLAQENVRTIDQPRSSEWGPDFSPDGAYVAYTSDESGRYEIYVRETKTLGRVWTISVDGGEEPVWSRDGTRLYFRYGDTWFASGIQTSPDFQASRPKVVMQGAYVNVPGRSYDVRPDGSFLVLRYKNADEASDQIEIVLNWFDELERLVPAEP